MIAPVVRPDVIEACVRGAVERLNSDGEMSHEEDLGDQAFIDQISNMIRAKSFTG